MSQTQVYKIPLKHDEEIYFTLKEFKGNQYFDMRIFFQSQKDGSALPSKKGLTLGVNLLDEFLKGVQELKNALEVKTVSN